MIHRVGGWPAPLVAPFCERTSRNGLTFGLGPAGYDIRVREDMWFFLGHRFMLASSVERFAIPTDLKPMVMDKSTWARRGLSVLNTTGEPGWNGYLTLELTYHRVWPLHVPAGAPIAEVVFEMLDQPTKQPYRGRYQDQPPWPVAAREEGA